MNSFLTDEERRAEIAAILAARLQRLNQRLALESATVPPAANSSATCLEVPDETVLTVHTG